MANLTQSQRQTLKRQRRIALGALAYIKNDTALDHEDPTVQQVLLSLAAGGYLRRPHGLAAAEAAAREPRQFTDATGTVRRLRALSHAGWTPTTIAHELGVSGDSIVAVRNRGSATVLATTAELVQQLYETRLDASPAPARAQTRVRNAAARNGWATPTQWLGLDMDDAGVQPHAVVVE